MTPEVQRPVPGPRKRVRKEMLINAIPNEEVRIAILEDGVLEELYVERSTQESFVGNIYRGKIVNIEPSIQAAFVDFGVGRNGFLHVSDVDPQYYKHITDGDGRGGRKDSLLDVLDIPEISAEEEAALEASALADDDEEEEIVETVEVIEDESDQEVTLDDDDEAPRERYRDRGPSRDYHRDGGSRGGRDRDGGRGRGGRDRNDRGPRDDNRSRDRGGRERHSDRAPQQQQPVQPAPVETHFAEAEPTPVPQPRHVAQPEAGNFGFGVLYESPTEHDNPPPSVVTEPPARSHVEHRHETAPIQSYSTSIEPVTTSQSSFDLEDFSFRTPDLPPAPPVASMPAAERKTEELLSDFDAFDVSFSSVKSQPAPVSEDFGVTFDAPVSETNGNGEAEVELSSEQSESLPSFDRGEEPESTIPTFNREMVDEPISFDESSSDELPDEPRPQRGYGDRRPSQRGGPRGRDDGRGRGGRGGFQRGGPDRRPRSPARDFGRDGPNAPPKPPIQEIFRRGQEVLVQVIKEGIGTKGPTLSTYISIPGRYLVVMPGLSRIGVSRKIGDEQQRRRLRTILQDLEPPRGLGFIIRTAGLDRTKKELQRDLAYLTRLWRVIASRIKKSRGPAPIYQESDIITRTIRDIFTNQIDKIRVDEPVSYQHAHEFMQFVMPRYADRLVLEQGLEPLFHRFGIEEEIGNIQNKRVPLNNGGSLVIDQTEALVAIDVNSGQFRQEKDAEENAFQMNMAAAKEVGRQLRLRDLGGVIVIDFIDMRDERHRRDIERALRMAIGRDRARTKVLRMSQFGIIQMTRQRIRPSLKRTNFDECPSCRATGLVKTGETMSIEVMRLLQLAAWRPNVSRVRLRVAENLAQYLLNRKRKEIAKLEDDGKIQVTILGVPNALPETCEIQCLDESGGEIRLTRAPEIKNKRGAR
ncbi:MAG TPA: Rne/Rng family ribonuclease [Gemmatales bacterium]|nr:Rne/Rng family ribonuclease [Gemmatales bacterium]